MARNHNAIDDGTLPLSLFSTDNLQNMTMKKIFFLAGHSAVLKHSTDFPVSTAARN
jgi:hypothetical protein